MAYSVISQNNTVTTLADENGNVIHVPSRVTLATSTSYSITKVNNSTATLEDGDGNILRDIPCVVVLAGSGGGGGGAVDSVNGHTGTVVLNAYDVNAVPQLATLPAVTSADEGKIVEYKGATNSTYTNGYFYRVNQIPATYTGTTCFDETDISGSEITCSAANFAQMCVGEGIDPQRVSYGYMVFHAGETPPYSSGWEITMYGSSGELLYQQLWATIMYTGWGFTFTGDLEDGDQSWFNVSLTPDTYTYGWQQKNVQPGATNIVYDSTENPDFTLQSNTIYNCTAEAFDLSIWLQRSYADPDFISQINFTSGYEPTELNSSAGIIWIGDDVSSTFIPASNKRYTILVYYDGLNYRAIVQGVDLE